MACLPVTPLRNLTGPLHGQPLARASVRLTNHGAANLIRDSAIGQPSKSTS